MRTERKDLSNISWMKVFDLIGEPNKDKCWKLYLENHEAIDKARGSKTKHQPWEGGLIDHICECVGIAEEMYASLSYLRPLPFSLSDAALVLFLHDMEKPWKHQVGEIVGGEKINNKIVDKQEFLAQRSTPQPENMNPKFAFCYTLAVRYGIELTDSQKNGLMYVEGEKNDYDPYVRVQGELAAFCHCCDVISARIWFAYPRG